MTVRIKCFARLRESLGIATRDVAHAPGMTVADVWRAVSDDAPPANLLCARNHEYVDFTRAVDDGDEIAFFPPVTGG